MSNTSRSMLTPSRVLIVDDHPIVRRGLKELITLSTQAFTYFQSKAGFSEGTPEDLPPSRRGKYDQSGRKSKILVKRLG